MPTQAEISLNPTSVKGDILTSSGSSRVRFPIGSEGQFLIADSSQSSGLSWHTAGGFSGDVYNRIAVSSLTSGNTQTITFNNIPATYSSLRIVAGMYAGNSGFVVLITCNNDTTSVYSSHHFYQKGTNAATGATQNSRPDGIYMSSFNTVGSTAYQATLIVDIPDYTATDKHKIALFKTTYHANNQSDGLATMGTGSFRSTSAITRVDLVSNSGSDGYGAGTVISLYGIKRNGL